MEIICSKVKQVLIEDQDKTIRRIIIETKDGDMIINLMGAQRIAVRRRRLEI